MVIRDDDHDRRVRKARGHAVYGGRISSIGARGTDKMTHATNSLRKSDGRASWVGRGRFAR